MMKVHKGYIDMRNDGEYLFVPNDQALCLCRGDRVFVQDIDLTPFETTVGDLYICSRGERSYVIDRD